MTTHDAPPVILASSSPWRRLLLERIGIAFEVAPAAIDETRAPGEPGDTLAERLARQKAERIATARPDAIVIGSDQVAEIDGDILGKPGSRRAAVAQLQQQSGRAVVFHTGLCVCAPAFDTPAVMVENVTTRFRPLDEAEIARYVDAENVTGTAGSLKSEGLGIALVDAIESRDPSTLVGLPLIAVCRLLRQAGVSVP